MANLVFTLLLLHTLVGRTLSVCVSVNRVTLNEENADFHFDAHSYKQSISSMYVCMRFASNSIEASYKFIASLSIRLFPTACPFVVSNLFRFRQTHNATEALPAITPNYKIQQSVLFTFAHTANSDSAKHA